MAASEATTRRRRRPRGARLEPRPRDLPADGAHAGDHQARRRPRTTSPSATGSCGRSRGGRRRSSAGRRACSRHRRLDAGEGRRRRLLPEARSRAGAPDYVQTARIQFPSGRHADEVCPTELAVVGWAAQMGTLTFHPWPVRDDDVDHPDELRLDLDPQPGTDFADAVRVAGEARALLDELGYARLPQDLGRPRDPHLRPDRAALDVHRRPPRRDRLRARARAAAAGAGDHQVVEGGARRADLPRLQPERARPHDRVRLQRPPEARRAGVGAAGAGTSCPTSRRRTSRSRPCRRASPRSATGTPRSTTPRTRWSRCSTLYERDEDEGRGDMPYPPDYPKMPGEPKRVQPSRDRDRPRD